MIEPGDAALTSIAFEISPDVRDRGAGRRAEAGRSASRASQRSAARRFPAAVFSRSRRHAIRTDPGLDADARAGADRWARRDQARPCRASHARSARGVGILCERHGLAGLRLDRGPLRLHAQRLRASHAEFCARARCAACIISHSSCAARPTCTRPATCSRGTSIQILWGPVRHGPGPQHRDLSPQSRRASGRAVFRSRPHESTRRSAISSRVPGIAIVRSGRKSGSACRATSGACRHHRNARSSHARA